MIREKDTLCWSCKNACGKCSWSKYFEPVEGWQAEPTKIKQLYNGFVHSIESFCIIKCPKYRKENGIKITNRALARQLGISERTLYRRLKKEKKNNVLCNKKRK